MEKYHQDFEESAELRSQVSKFTNETLAQDKAYENLATQIKKLLLNEVTSFSKLNKISVPLSKQ